MKDKEEGKCFWGRNPDGTSIMKDHFEYPGDNNPDPDDKFYIFRPWTDGMEPGSFRNHLFAQTNYKGVFAGAGSDMFGEGPVVDAVIGLTGKAAAEVRLVYLGTATYDLHKYKKVQTSAFTERGVKVTSIDVATQTPLAAKTAEIIDQADAILVSGGNTLYAVDRWQKAGLVGPLKRAADRGAVLCGGSAGAICWFDGGHSDSMDPDWYRKPMLAGKDPGDAGAQKGAAKSWEYIRVDGLGFLRGMICPHHDRVQSNGVVRAKDFDGMLRRHGAELGVCIDHYAALVVDGEKFRVLSLPNKPGSLMEDGSLNLKGKGKPGIWLKNLNLGDGCVLHKAATAPIDVTPLPSSGKARAASRTGALLPNRSRARRPLPRDRPSALASHTTARVPRWQVADLTSRQMYTRQRHECATGCARGYYEKDPRVEQCRKENPSDVQK